MLESKESLSERELDILRLVATGAANKEIARQLVISPNTVKVHLRNIFAKIGVASRTEATLYAVQIGLVTPQVNGAEAENGADTLASTAQASPDDLAAGLPGITIEGQDHLASSNAPAARRGTFARIGLRWSALAVVIALLLVGAGMFGSRFLTPSSLVPVAASQAPTPQPQPFNTRWSDKKPLPAPRKGMGAVIYENNFYLIGGETSGGIDGALLSYDPAANTWKTLAKKPTPVTDIQAVLLGERIYVPGGRMANGKATNILEVYNPRQNTWESRAPLPMAVSGYAIAAFEGDLYLFGGKNGSQYFSSVYQYDPKADQWQKHSEMSSPRAYAAVITDSEKIYVIGGYDGSHALTLNEVYFPTRDPSTDKPWESLTPMPHGRYGMGIAHLVNIIYLLGGLQDNGAPADPPGLQYITRSDQWMGYDKPTRPVGAYPALFTLGNFIYTFGGETSQGLTASGLAYQAIYTISSPIQIKP